MIPLDSRIQYTPPATNVFQATELDWTFLIFPYSDWEPDYEDVIDKWFWAEVSWKVFHGPYETYDEANTAFQVYAREVKMCPSGGCED